MDNIEKLLNDIFCQFGWIVLLIAIAGVIILGILKYCNVFKKLDEKYRHYIYIAISVGFSVIVTIIYLACIHKLTFACVCAVTAAMFTLNQAAYAVYANTPLKALLNKLLDKIKDLIKKSNKVDDETKELTDKITDKIEEVIDEKLPEITSEEK